MVVLVHISLVAADRIQAHADAKIDLRLKTITRLQLLNGDWLAILVP